MYIVTHYVCSVPDPRQICLSKSQLSLIKQSVLASTNKNSVSKFVFHWVHAVLTGFYYFPLHWVMP